MIPETVTIILPLPPSVLNTNGQHGHWSKRAKALRKCRKLAYLETQRARVESGPWENVEVQAAFFHRMKRRRDGANFNPMLKGYCDGIVDAGLAVDDDYEHWTPLAPTFAIDKENPRVELTITRKDNDAETF